jgi:hypothetical protein
MHKNPFFLTLLACLAAAALTYSVIAIYKYIRYASLTATAQAEEMQWDIKAHARMKPLDLILADHYFVQAHYNFYDKDKKHAGKTRFKESYLNSWAAEQAIKDFEKQSWTVWYEPGKGNHSTLQKNFPLKECISAGVLWALLVYFIWLGCYVAANRV